jgi:PIN domain nuclease of toxin-antitoxin system
MMLLDTHVWVWWIEENPMLAADLRLKIDREDVVAISPISCWEVAMKAARGTMQFSLPIERWFELALSLADVRLLAFTPEVALESTRLPGAFHKDPADRIIVATSRQYRVPLATQDAEILAYHDVEHVRFGDK